MPCREMQYRLLVRDQHQSDQNPGMEPYHLVALHGLDGHHRKDYRRQYGSYRGNSYLVVRRDGRLHMGHRLRLHRRAFCVYDDGTSLNDASLSDEYDVYEPFESFYLNLPEKNRAPLVEKVENGTSMG